MAGPDRIEWRRGSASRAWGRLGWYVTLGATAVVIGYILFGAEPDRLDGRVNPLALVPAAIATLVGLCMLPSLVALVRRPLVCADHYALAVRPGILRTLLVPWARIVEIAAHGARDEPFLLVRCGNASARLGDRPRWWDKTVLRSAIRAGRNQRSAGRPAVEAYDLAVRMDAFHGDPHALLAALAAFAPHHVVVADELR